MKIFESGKLWPYAIGLAITMVFGLGVWTVITTNSANVQLSNNYMMKYQAADAKANDLIKSRIAFNKKYTIEYLNNALKDANSIVRFKVTTSDGTPVESAKLKVLVSRPETHVYDETLVKPSVEDGVYTFTSAKFPKKGVWNLMTHVTVGDNSRFYNIKADTRKEIPAYSYE